MTGIIANKVCLVDKCGIKSTRRSGYCSKHHYRYERYGDALKVHEPRQGCIVRDCVGKHHANGYCGKHNARVQNHKDAHYVAQIRDGRRKHPLCNTWYSMLARCSTTSNPSYKYYGGKGISVCSEWADKVSGFWKFVEDMGDRPKGTTLDRIDGNKGYYKGNCRWATIHQQNSNLSKNNRYVGVMQRSGSRRWYAYMYIDKVRYNLGTHETEEQAYEARKAFEASFLF